MVTPEPCESATIGVELRAFAPGEVEFLYQVYASSRQEEMALVVDWSDAQKQAFLRDQFRLQHHHYQTHYPNARYDVIVKDGDPIGRLYVTHMNDEIRLMDITLLPAHRSQGIGSALIQQLMDEASETGKFLSLHVEDHNPAKRLYGRMGFVEVGEVSFYRLMHWHPTEVKPEVRGRGGD